MKFRKALLTLPLLALVGGAFTLTAANKANAKLVEEISAAEYYGTGNELTRDDVDGSVTATFTVTSSDLDMQGWLLILFDEKPLYASSTRYLDSRVAPYGREHVAHYFFCESNAANGTLNITWDGTFTDQSEVWSNDSVAEGATKTLNSVWDEGDWYFAIGPRHFNNEWAHIAEEPGKGLNDIYENCDYYVGRKSAIFGDSIEGETFLDLTQLSAWGADAKSAVYYWDKNEHNGWSDFAFEHKDRSNILVARYELDFTPTGMKIVRFNPAAETPSWESKYNEGKDEKFFEFGVIGVTGWDGETWAGALSSIETGSKQYILSEYQRNGSSHSEHFNEYIELNTNDEFRILFNGNYYSSYSTHYSLSSFFSVSDGKIVVNRGAAYSFYFDTDNQHLYITSPNALAADKWSNDFISVDCDDNLENWEYTYSGDYSDLSSEAQFLLRREPHVDHEAVVTEPIARAIQRYDYVLERYGAETYEDFIGRLSVHNDILSSSRIVANNFNNDGFVPLIVIVTSLTSLSLLSLLIIKKKSRVSQRSK